MPRLPFLLLVFALGSALPGCGPSSRVPITRTRPLTEAESSPVLGAGSRDRFKFALPSMPSTPTLPSSPPDSGPLQWSTPEGWRVQEHPMRDISLAFGESGECYVMRAGGTVADNVNRWRQQMGLPALSAEEVAGLPTRPLFGKPAVFTALDGTFKGMGAQDGLPDHRLLGLILPEVTPGQSLFIKMVGPRAQVEANEASFQAFCDSLRLADP
jgi:hypothetical protein